MKQEYGHRTGLGSTRGLCEGGGHAGCLAGIWRRARSLALGSALAVTLAACDGHDDVYFLMEFDAVVEGEPFAFETKLVCTAKEASTGTPFKKRTYFGLERISFGMKLKSGKGAFVAAPDICGWYFRRARRDDEPSLVWTRDPQGQAFLPMIYVTDNYENPTHMRLYANPNGPDPATGVALRKAVLRPLTKKESRAAPERPKDDHDPFHTYKEPSWRGHVFLRFDEELVSEVDPSELLLETERYRLYRQPDPKWEHTPYRYAEKYWTFLWRAVPLNEAIGFDKHKIKTVRDEAEKQRVTQRYGMARKGFADNISTVLDGETLYIDLENRGVIDLYRRSFYKPNIRQNGNLKLALKGSDTKFPANPSFLEGFVLQDISSKQLYRVVGLNFRVHI